MTVVISALRGELVGSADRRPAAVHAELDVPLPWCEPAPTPHGPQPPVPASQMATSYGAARSLDIAISGLATIGLDDRKPFHAQ